jgi:hypothetical protein
MTQLDLPKRTQTIQSQTRASLAVVRLPLLLSGSLQADRQLNCSPLPSHQTFHVAPHLEPLTDTWTSDFLSREGEGREVIGERLRDKTVPWQVQRRLMQAVTNSFQVYECMYNAPCFTTCCPSTKVRILTSISTNTERCMCNAL